MVRCLTVAYRGTEYSGWQRQPNATTVQQRLEEALEELLGESVRVVGAGRTDAGVHARGQVAHITATAGDRDGSAGAELPDSAFVHGTNRHLPPDIRVLAAGRMADGFHARKSALSKVYSYRMVPTLVMSPLDGVFAVQIDPRVQVEAMSEAATGLVGWHDFSAFALAGGAHSDPRRLISRAELLEGGRGDLVFEVEGNGFLRGMVRSLVGTLLAVGLGKMTPEQFLKLLRGAPRSEAGPTAPPQGLVLERVHYPPPAAE
jgi:tRNA pseudouridine38-40 synthase